MSKRVFFFSVPLALVILVSWVGSAFSADEKVTVIKAADLQDGKYTIVGLLGKPYGEKSEIEGVWEREPEKDQSGKRKKCRMLFFRITQIDGKPVDADKDIRFYSGRVYVLQKALGLKNSTGPTEKFIAMTEPYERRLGKKVKATVFEAGGYCGENIRYPEWVQELLDNSQAVQDPYQKGFRFHSFLFIVDNENTLKQSPFPGFPRTR